MSERKYYCVCDDDSKFETMTKEQILTAIAQAMETGEIGNCDTGFITTIKETNSGEHLKFWIGTRAQYNAVRVKDGYCLYIISDDTTKEDFERSVTSINERLTALETKQSVRFENWETTLENNGSSSHDCGGTVTMVIVTARYKNAGPIMTGTWTPATSGMENLFYGKLGANNSLDNWNTTVTISGSKVTVTRGAAGNITYYCTAVIV